MGNRRHRHQLTTSALLESISSLKMAQASARQGKRRRGSGVYTHVHEYFEAAINAVSCRMRQFSTR